MPHVELIEYQTTREHSGDAGLAGPLGILRALLAVFRDLFVGHLSVLLQGLYLHATSNTSQDIAERC